MLLVIWILWRSQICRMLLTKKWRLLLDHLLLNWRCLWRNNAVNGLVLSVLYIVLQEGLLFSVELPTILEVLKLRNLFICKLNATWRFHWHLRSIIHVVLQHDWLLGVVHWNIWLLLFNLRSQHGLVLNKHLLGLHLLCSSVLFCSLVY